jgi:hypothetical protein
MVKFKIALAIGACMLINHTTAQYTYFSNAYNTDGQNEISTNIIVSDSTYQMFGIRFYSGNTVLNSRSIDSDGTPTSLNMLTVEDYFYYFINFAESVVRLEDGSFV